MTHLITSILVSEVVDMMRRLMKADARFDWFQTSTLVFSIQARVLGLFQK